MSRPPASNPFGYTCPLCPDFIIGAPSLFALNRAVAVHDDLKHGVAMYGGDGTVPLDPPRTGDTP